MPVTRVLVVSDTHLSNRTPEAVANWDAVVRYANERTPALVVHVGDVTADGTSDAEDLALARRELGQLNAPLHVVPGNHDVGDGTLSPTGLQRYRAALGPDCWQVDLPGWRLLGLDAPLFGSGLDDERTQWDWLTCALVEWAELPTPTPPRARPRLGLVLHKPLRPTPLHPADTTPPRYVPPAARDRLRDVLRPAPHVLVLSGHCHQFSHHTDDAGLTSVWIPSTWAIIPSKHQPRFGDRVCGVVELRMGDDGDLRVQLIQPAGLRQHVLGESIEDPYDHASRSTT